MVLCRRGHSCLSPFAVDHVVKPVRVRQADFKSKCQLPSFPNREHLNTHSTVSRNGLPYRCLSFEDRSSSDKTLPR
jgi:hypothetical protein